MKHIIEVEKPKSRKYSSKIEKATKYSYKTIIPSEVMKMFPQLKEDGSVVYEIKQVSIDKFECDIYFKSAGLKVNNIADDKKPAPTIDEVKEKSTETKTINNNESIDAGIELDVKKFDDVPIQDGKYIIKVTSPKNPQLRITGKTIKQEINTEEIRLRVANKDELEVRAIITKLKSVTDADAKQLNDIINSYRPERYRT